MKIADIRAHVMNIPAADGHTPRRNWIFVEVETDAGITGVGEATTEHHEMAVAAQVETALKPRLLGMNPMDVEQVWQLGYRDYWWKRGVVHTSAVSGIDMALWDIAGKATGQPVFRLLGGRVRNRVRCYARADLGLDSLEAHAAQALEEGFDAFKHGHGPAVAPFDMDAQVDVAVREMTRLREALGPDAALMIDCGGVFSPTAAHRLMRELQALDMFFVEEPMEQSTVEPYVRLKRDFPGMRVAAGERWITRWECREWFERQAVDVCQVDICHVGGVSELMKVAHFRRGVRNRDRAAQSVWAGGAGGRGPRGGRDAEFRNSRALQTAPVVRRRADAAGADFGRIRGRRRTGAAPGAWGRTGYGSGEVPAISGAASPSLRRAGRGDTSRLRAGTSTTGHTRIYISSHVLKAVRSGDVRREMMTVVRCHDMVVTFLSVTIIAYRMPNRHGCSGSLPSENTGMAPGRRRQHLDLRPGRGKGGRSEVVRGVCKRMIDSDIFVPNII